MRGESLPDYMLKFRESELFLEANETSEDAGLEYVVPYSGSIVCRRRASEEELPSAKKRDRIVGRFQGWVIHAARAINDGIDLWDHCDAHSQDLHDYATTFYDADGGFKGELIDEFENLASGSNLLIVDEIAVEPAHRGRMVGLRTLRRLLEVLGDGCGFAATIAYPLQFQEDGVGRFERHPERNRECAEQRLGQYIAQFGFTPLPGTSIYAWPMDRNLPRIESVRQPDREVPSIRIASQQGRRVSSAENESHLAKVIPFVLKREVEETYIPNSYIEGCQDSWE